MWICGSNSCIRVLQNETSVFGDRTPGGASLAGVSAHHSRELLGATVRQPHDPPERDSVEERLQNHLVERRIREGRSRIRVLASDRLDDGKRVVAYGFHAHGREPTRL